MTGSILIAISLIFLAGWIYFSYLFHKINKIYPFSIFRLKMNETAEGSRNQYLLSWICFIIFLILLYTGLNIEFWKLTSDLSETISLILFIIFTILFGTLALKLIDFLHKYIAGFIHNK